MTLSGALEMLRPIVGITSLVMAPSSVDGEAVRSTPTLAHAEERVASLTASQQAAESDAAWWGWEGQLGYWRCLVDLLKAAALTGPDDLPDVDPPKYDGIVMDDIYAMEDWGARTLAAAKARIPADR